MAIAEFTQPLPERIARWVESAPTTLSRILLHPEDFLSMTQTKRDIVEAQYNLPIVILGGRVALLRYVAEHSNRQDTENMDDIVYADPAGESGNDITFVDPNKELEDA